MTWGQGAFKGEAGQGAGWRSRRSGGPGEKAPNWCKLEDPIEVGTRPSCRCKWQYVLTPFREGKGCARCGRGNSNFEGWVATSAIGRVRMRQATL